MRDLLDRLQSGVDATIAASVGPSRRVAVLNFANHANVGDGMLWLGLMASLDRTGAEVVHHCEWQTYRPDELAKALGPDDHILLAGGGNLGDQYPAQQTRDSVLLDFPDHRIVQTAQSIWFADPTRLDHFADRTQRHGDFHLQVRDRASLDLATDRFAEVTLTPDTAFGLAPFTRRANPVVPVRWLARTDRESAHETPSTLPDGWEVFDWLSLPDPVEAAAIAGSRADGLSATERGAMYTRFASTRLDHGLRLLSGGHVAVVDRLHAHILCLQAGIPHVVVSSRTGKTRSFLETWTHPAGVPVAESTEHATRLANELLVA